MSVKMVWTVKPTAQYSTEADYRMPLLDKIPDNDWFFCFPLYIGVYCITFLGILHPLLWISVMRVYRSELFVFMYVLIGFWSFLSIALLYAIVEESACIYGFWIWYSMVFCIVMAAMMFLLFCGFCVLGMRRKSIVALVGLLYYMVTFYFVVVVNKQRKEVFGIKKYDCGDCTANRLARIQHLQDLPYNTTWSSVTYETTSQPPATQPVTIPLTSEPMTVVTTTTTSYVVITQPTYDEMRSAAVAALVSVAANMTTTEMERLPRVWIEPIEDPARRAIQDTTAATIDKDRLAAIARLSELLINSNECRKPRKPAHGRYTVKGRRGPSSSMLKITLRCDMGYRESSIATECKNNWWDRPIPQCRKRRPPPPLPLPGGGCVLPGYPAHGEYTVADHARARPGDRVAGENVILLVSCDEPYRAVDPYVICVEGRWRHAPPSCQKHCKLVFDPTVEYKCLKAFKDEFLSCGAWQPEGAVVAAACRPGHAHRGPFRYMKCRGETWDHVVSCLPNANFSR